MSNVKYVKVCGITSYKDIEICIEAGADAVGFLVGLNYESEDQLSPTHAAELVREVPPLASSVLVTHRATRDGVLEICAQVPATHLQLHGDYPIENIADIREAFPHLKIIKSVHVVGPESIAVAEQTARYSDAILLDTRTATRIGGTGKVHDWAISSDIRKHLAPNKVILAGGLNCDNIEAAIDQVQPYAVDVNTGVSARRGEKSPELVNEFILRAKQTSHRLNVTLPSSFVGEPAD